MITFPELLSNSERTSGPLTCRLQQNGIRLPTVDHTEGGQANVAKILQFCQQHCSIQLLVCTCARVQYVYSQGRIEPLKAVRGHATVQYVYYTKYAYCTGAYVSSLYIALSAPLMTTPTMVQKYILVVW